MVKGDPCRDRRPFSIGKQILFSAIIIVTFLLLAEGAVRVYALVFRTPYEHYNRQTGRLELVPNLQYTDRHGDEFRINARGFVGPEFDQSPPEGVVRIIAVGDSCTFLLGFWRFAYPSILERYLNATAGGRRFEVINAGIEGYNSTFAKARIEEELIGYRPQVVLIYIGWNDLMKIDPRSMQAAGRYSALTGLMEQSYLVRAYRKAMFVHLRPLLFQPRVGVDTHSDDYDEYVPAGYQSNLRSSIETLRSHGIQSVLMTLPTVVRPDMSRAELEEQHVFFPYFAGTYSVGQFLSLHRSYNRVVRDLGERLNVPVVDLDAAFERHAKEPLFWDTMHPSRKGHCLIADELFAHVAPRYGLGTEVRGSDEAICR
jgi:lysophospholipase L1-like esterase